MRKYALKVGIMTYMVGNGRPDQSVLMHRLIRAIVDHNEVVLTSNHNLSLWEEIRKLMYTPVNANFTV